MDPTPLVGAQTLHPNSEKKDTPQISYSPAQHKYIMFRRQRMIAARDQRDALNPKFDNIPFLEWCDIMEKADDQFVAPRRNAQDTSINTGSTRDKDTTLVEYAMKYDFEPVAQVFDENDDIIENLAETSEDLVRKSLLMEQYRDKAKLIYRSMVTFGTSLVQDLWMERWVIDKTMKNGFKPGLGTDKVEWEERMVKKVEGCQAKLWDIRACYFGDIRKFFMNGPEGQPYFFHAEYKSYDEVKSIFGNWDRWEYVSTFIQMTPEMIAAQTWSSYWTLRPININSVEIIYYYDPVANEVGITLNGVDMLPIMEKKVTAEDGSEKTLISGYPLTEVSPSGVIPFAKFDLEPMHAFAYSKPQPAKMRVWQDVENMMVKLFIGMFKQKAKPTMGNQSGRTFGPEVTDPATVINDIRDGDLFPVLPNYEGASAQDFTFYEVVKKELDKNSVERSFQGIDNQPGEETATEDINDMKAQSLKVAALMDGIISGNAQLYWLRTFNIIRNWTKPIDQRVDGAKKQIVDIYRTVTLPSEIDGGQKATKKIVFTKSTPKRPAGKPTLEDSMKVHQQEVDHVKDGGQEMRITYLHPELYATIKLNWFYTCVPVPNGADPFSYMIFAKQINDATMMFGAQSLNVKKLKHRFASKTGEDFDTWFISDKELQINQASQQMQNSQQGAQGMNGGQGSQGSAVSAPAPMSPVNQMKSMMPANKVAGITR